jgi:hypothetical protein
MGSYKFICNFELVVMKSQGPIAKLTDLVVVHQVVPKDIKDDTNAKYQRQ